MKDELWWTYLADYDGRPGSIVVNMALKGRSPDAAMPTALVTGVSYDSPEGSSGLPDAAELEFLNRLAEKRLPIIKARSKCFVHVGTFTGDHKRYDYFYLADPVGLEDALRRFYDAECPARDPYVNIRDDPKWDRYMLFLYPNPQTIQFYRAELEKIGAL